MSPTVKCLEALTKGQKKFLQKGGLCVALVVTRTAKERGLPLNANALRTEERGQVVGLGKAGVQRILEQYGINKVLAEEGGRTSRGSLGLMETYVEALNALFAQGGADLEIAEQWWIEKVHLHFASEGPKFVFDPGRSLHSNITNLLVQAQELQRSSGGTAYVGAVLQHLVGAKLDLVLGAGKITHHGFSVADNPTKRGGDYQIDAVSIHVTTNPSEALIRKCEANLNSGLKPVIITLGDGVSGAVYMLNARDLADRVDVLDAGQFLTANVYEHSLFLVTDCKPTLTKLLKRYNEIVTECETDPSLQINLGELN